MDSAGETGAGARGGGVGRHNRRCCSATCQWGCGRPDSAVTVGKSQSNGSHGHVEKHELHIVCRGSSSAGRQSGHQPWPRLSQLRWAAARRSERVEKTRAGRLGVCRRLFHPPTAVVMPSRRKTLPWTPFAPRSRLCACLHRAEPPVRSTTVCTQLLHALPRRCRTLRCLGRRQRRRRLTPRTRWRESQGRSARPSSSSRPRRSAPSPSRRPSPRAC
jgi:hypothetical protein